MNKKALIISLTVAFIMLSCVGLSIFFIVTNSDKIAQFNTNYKVSKKVILDEEYDADLKKLVINADASEIKIKNTDSQKVRVVVYSEKNNLKITKDEDLKIKVDNMKNCKFFCIDLTVPKVVVYIPNSFDKKVEIINQLGDINIDDIDKVNIKTDLGDIDIDRVNSVKIVSDAGDIEINKVNKYLNIKESAGDIKIKRLNITKDSVINMNLGDIKIGSTNEIYINAKIDLGDIKINNNYRKADTMLTIKNSMGDIKVDN